jgi:4-oxalmesaconate hydratase
VDLYPENFVGVCQLPQSPGVPIANSIAELQRCVTELGFVGCNLNPDPSGGHWQSPPLTDKHWYPFYEQMVALDVPAMVQSGVVQSKLSYHRRALHQCRHDSVHAVHRRRPVHDFHAALRHSARRGGAYHWGRYRGLADMLKRSHST